MGPLPMRFPPSLPCALLVAAVLVAGPAYAQGAGRDGLVGVVVVLEAPPLARYRGSLPGLPATARARTGAPRLRAGTPASRAYLAHLESELGAFEITARGVAPAMRALYRHRAVVGGVSLRVPEAAIPRLAALPGVREVYRDGLARPDTERSWRFIGAHRTWRALGGAGRAGEGVVVGVLDTGIWPEHPSFADPDPDGRPYPPPPSSWNGGAGPECQAPGPADPCAPLACSNKLIGAFAFLDTYKASSGLLPGECDSARDTDGHGTHTASTAAGNGDVAIPFDRRRGLFGVAPRAHVAAYRVCAEDGCYFTDSVAAIDQAVLDGVDVINFSIGGGGSPYADIVSLAFRDAYAAGVFVAASAGNDGPGANTVAQRAPWVTTVGASTQKRAFETMVTLRGAGGGRLRVRGASLTEGNGDLDEVAVALAASFGDSFCLAPFAPATFAGDLVVCQRGINARTSKGLNVLAGGAGGMILINPTPQGVSADSHFLPTAHLEADAGETLIDFLFAHGGASGSLRDFKARRADADVVASFSSRGGSGQTLGVSKPDVTAPGVQILAGNSPQKHVDDGSLGAPGLFQAIQGTSMSSPHVAGAGALLRQLHPDWTPGQIKSALMTTARTRRLFAEDGETPAGSFDAGSGRIDLKYARDPGLTFDAGADDYVAHESDLWHANYPSLYVPAAAGLVSVSVERRPLNVEDRERRYRIRVRTPRDSRLEVHTFPDDRLTLPPNGEAVLLINVDMGAMQSGEVGTATLELRGGGHKVHLPITAVRP